ncbi:hypothetical protein KCP70_07620 [Salmonella enterica subsp. enterica]|nr:hypothetical protein KCP70_07620 [Salmonella enterica subsp. enterica]
MRIFAVDSIPGKIRGHHRPAHRTRPSNLFLAILGLRKMYLANRRGGTLRC